MHACKPCSVFYICMHFQTIFLFKEAIILSGWCLQLFGRGLTFTTFLLTLRWTVHIKNHDGSVHILFELCISSFHH